MNCADRLSRDYIVEHTIAKSLDTDQFTSRMLEHASHSGKSVLIRACSKHDQKQLSESTCCSLNLFELINVSHIDTDALKLLYQPKFCPSRHDHIRRPRFLENIRWISASSSSWLIVCGLDASIVENVF